MDRESGIFNLWQAFAAVADGEADAPALILADRRVSFAELKALSERYAAQLGAWGVKHGDVVALQLPKRTATYALLLACLRLGAPYVFLDPKNPADRSRRILDRVRPAVLFTTVETANAYGRLVRLAADDIDGFGAGAPLGSTRAEPARVLGSDPAYIMFTSGSTGEPKGAVIPHRGVLSLMRWARTKVSAPRCERFTNINPLHFDNSVFDIYCGLLNGAALVPVETAELNNPAAWVRTIRSAAATTMFAVPTLFLVLDRLHLLTPQALPDIKVFLFGGEGYPIGRLRDFHSRFAGRARLINVYGPTETSCISTSIEIDEATLAAPDSEFPPLGYMHDDFTYSILDEGLTPVGAGRVGELWIGGPCVGLGYYANPEETEKRFRLDPGPGHDQSVWYRSGDLVREDAYARLWFHGRVDNQVKIRGHRIELEEIDLAVQSVPGVRRAVAVVLPGEDGGELNVAFMGDRTIAAEEIYALCRAKLPSYMHPARVFQLDDLPRNANGKVDRLATRALLERMISTKCRQPGAG